MVDYICTFRKYCPDRDKKTKVCTWQGGTCTYNKPKPADPAPAAKPAEAPKETPKPQEPSGRIEPVVD